MEINHRVSLCWDKIKRGQLADLGIEVNEGFDAFEISESNAAWPDVQRLIAAWDPVDVVITEFSRSELRSASYLKIGADGHHGYPQPEKGFGYLKETYDV